MIKIATSGYLGTNFSGLELGTDPMMPFAYYSLIGIIVFYVLSYIIYVIIYQKLIQKKKNQNESHNKKPN